eukprot:6214598-Pleurochrysis_carterae.AAC.3
MNTLRGSRMRRRGAYWARRRLWRGRRWVRASWRCRPRRWRRALDRRPRRSSALGFTWQQADCS